MASAYILSNATIGCRWRKASRTSLLTIIRSEVLTKRRLIFNIIEICNIRIGIQVMLKNITNFSTSIDRFENDRK